MKRRSRIGSIITVACLLSILLLLEGCYRPPPSSGVHFPITSGSHTLLPDERQRILIWGDPLLARVAEEWLRSHHYSNILMQPRSPYMSSDRQEALAAAAEKSAEFVLVLERETLKDGALLQPDCGALSNITVEVQGLSVERGGRVLRGNAHYPQCVGPNDQTFQNLTCQALATAWGFRASGQLEIPSHLACTAGQRTPAPNH